MKKLILLLAFGNITLPVVTYILTKKYYEKRMKKEVETRVNAALTEIVTVFANDVMPEAIKERTNETAEQVKNDIGIEPRNPDLDGFVKKYTDYTSYYASGKKEESDQQEEEPPHRLNKVREFIDQKDLGERWGLESIETFNFYTDNVLTDSDMNIITDANENVGIEAVKTFKSRVVNGSVCVRNYELETDYEILEQPRRYADIHKE